jgi:hypothetical protein
LAALAVAATSASAATVSVTDRTLDITDQAGEVNVINVEQLTPELFTIHDEHTFLEPGPPCVALALDEVVCQAPVDMLRIRAGAGDDDVILDGVSVKVDADGGPGDDFIDGGTSNDVLDGGPGADALAGLSGNDELAGGAGSDLIKGGDGADTMSGGAGDDLLYGQASNVTLLQGGDGRDLIKGGPGNDALKGGDGSDVLVTGTGKDTASTQDGKDQVFATPNDQIACGSEASVQYTDGEGTALPAASQDPAAHSGCSALSTKAEVPDAWPPAPTAVAASDETVTAHAATFDPVVDGVYRVDILNVGSVRHMVVRLRGDQNTKVLLRVRPQHGSERIKPFLQIARTRAPFMFTPQPKRARDATAAKARCCL